MNAIRDVVELDLSPAAAGEATTAFFKDLIRDLLGRGFVRALILERDIAQHSHDEAPQASIGPGGDVERIVAKEAQRGFRSALVFSDAEQPRLVVEAHGYVRSDPTAGSRTIADNWTKWITRHAPEARGVVVFGHDYTPIFIFGSGSQDEAKRDSQRS